MSDAEIRRIRGFACIALDRPKTALNIGSALRNAHNFGAASVIVSGQRFTKCATDTLASYRHLPLIQVDDLFAAIPYDCVPVAIERSQGARSLISYTHPHSAFYVFGPEDGSVRGDILARCRDVIQVPTEQCLNLAATVAIVLYDRALKRHRAERKVPMPERAA